ncbi:AAA family ATPase [Streptomyces sp. MUM 178J]|uniref:AAA family ATPase n=1 Tax=Streptomyces sp. MUM 178J TaxID=2791991 RepID=UPI001F039053|nr:AAA family ATPase [Streptomyces sp. MUM 178J]WRQ81710.1 AAA family ATPase [Streptomyces sp. MUM 178J]
MEPTPVDTEPAAGAVLLTGIPGSGKSTVAAALAACFPKAAHIEVDRLQEMIVSGGRHPTPEGDREADRQILLRARNACLLADSFAAAGFLPVIDDVVVRRSHLAFYRRTLVTRPLHVIVLAPGPDTAWQRNLARDKTLTTNWAPLDAAAREELADEGAWIDNAPQSAAETVDAVLAATALAPLSRPNFCSSAGAAPERPRGRSCAEHPGSAHGF